MPHFDVRLLGPLEVRIEGKSVVIPRGNASTLLAILLDESNRVVPLQSLITAVYGMEIPSNPQVQVQNTIGVLRRLLEEAGGQEARTRLRTVNGAYQFDMQTGELDVLRCRSNDAEARRLQSDGKLAEAAASLRTALDEWRSPALADLVGQAVESIRRRYDEYRLTLLERRIDLDLELGRHADVVEELREVVAVHEKRLVFTGQLMRALHASGRTPEALDVYAAAKARTSDSLGSDPGRALRDLHTAILQDDAGSGTGVFPVAAAEPRVVVPEMLPRTIARFTGRVSEIRALDEQLKDAEGAAGLSVVTGTGGVGKTTLAVHWAHRVAHRFPDGQLYFNLHGFDPVSPIADTSTVLAEALTALGVESHRIPAGLNERTGLFRTVLARRRVLIVLDNARDPAQVQALLPVAPGSFALVTSRDRLSALRKAEDADAVALGLMPDGDARTLLLRRIGSERALTEENAIDRILAICGRLPIALTLIGGWAASNPGLSLSLLADRLKSATSFIREMGRLDPAADPRTVFACSYQLLSSRAASVFRLFGLHPGPDLTAAAMASLMGVPVPDAETALAELVSGNLVDQSAEGRYTMHDLLRAYAKERFTEEVPELKRHAAALRLVEHYLFTANAADAVLARYRHHADLGGLATGVTPESIPNPPAAAAWFDDEYQVMRNLVVRFDAGGEGDVRIWQLGWILAEYLLDRYQWQDLREIQYAALAASERSEDVFGRVVSLGYLSTALCYLGEDQHGADLIASAIDLAEVHHQSWAKGFIHYARAVLSARVGEDDDALEHAMIARECFRENGDLYWEYRSVHLVGWHSAKTGDFEGAQLHVGQLMKVAAEANIPLGVASAHLGYGFIAHHKGRYAEALVEYGKARQAFAEYGGEERLAYTDELSGDTHMETGDTESARLAWYSAEQGYMMFGMLDEAERIRTKLKEPGQRSG